MVLLLPQVDALVARGVKATYINSSLKKEEVLERLRALRRGEWQLAYIAPERFTPNFVDALKGVDVRLLAVDEAHCISQFGHDFRPSYGRVGEVRRALGMPPVVAMTATATAEVRADIVTSLGLTAAAVFARGFDRPNLALEVLRVGSQRPFAVGRFAAQASATRCSSINVSCSKALSSAAVHTRCHFPLTLLNKFMNLNAKSITRTRLPRTNLTLQAYNQREKLKRLPTLLAGRGAALVYCASRGGVEAAVAHLSAAGLAGGVEAYHAGLPDARRAAVQERFLSGTSRVVVATNAFGLGIDKADVRTVVHLDAPGTVEAYYQVLYMGILVFGAKLPVNCDQTVDAWSLDLAATCYLLRPWGFCRVAVPTLPGGGPRGAGRAAEPRGAPLLAAGRSHPSLFPRRYAPDAGRGERRGRAPRGDGQQ